MWDFMAKIDEKAIFSGVIFKYSKEIPFQYSTFDTLKKCQ